MAALAGPRRERSPPRGDRRPLATRNRSRERRAAAGDSNKESYQQLREKALMQRSKTVPAETFYIGEDKRSRPVPPRNQAALNRRAAPRAPGVKREASAPAVDRRTRTRGGAADVARAEVRDFAFARQAEKQKSQKSQKKNPNLYECSAGNVKARKKPKQ